MCFVWISEQTAIISLYSINWLVCITETECVYCAVRTGSLYTASLTFSDSTVCPHSAFMCFVWISEQTAIISLYNINWLVFITETLCVYCAVGTGSLPIIRVNFPNVNFPNVHFPNAPHSSSSTCFSYYKDKRQNLPRSNARAEIREHWMGRYFAVFVLAGWIKTASAIQMDRSSVQTLT